MAKRIRVSDDNGANYYTLPGASGEKREELAMVNDTIFGQDYSSEQPSIGNWSIQGNAFWKGVAGYSATVQQSGIATVMTAEACTLVSGKTYQITSAAKRVISLVDALTVLDNAVDHTADVVSVDYLNGTVTFDAGYTVTGPVTVTGKYLPVAAVAKARTFNLNQSAAEIDETDYALAQANGGWREYSAGLKSVGLDIGGMFDTTAAFETALAARSLVILDIHPDGTADSMFRGFFKRKSHQQGGDVGAVEDEQRSFSLWVPDGDLIEQVFSWYFTNTTVLNTAVRKVLTAFLDKTTLKVQYLQDGVNGKVGDAIVTEASLANSYEGQNEFRFTFRGTGALAAVP